MARTDQGNTLLTLIHQTDAEFIETPAGFDTGRRVFECDSSKAERLAPRRGESDVVVMRRAAAAPSGSSRRTFALMFVESCVETFRENGISRFSVAYFGLKFGRSKLAPVDEDTDIQRLSEVPAGGAIHPVTYMRPIPTITRTYVGTRIPDIREAGQAMIPPGYARDWKPDHYFQNQLAARSLLFSGWILKKRTNRIAGHFNRGGGGLVETTDVFTYELIEMPE